MDKKQKLAIFKKSVRGLLKQNKQSICDGECVYLNPEGLRCAIGMLITKESYNPRIEYQSVADDNVKQALEESGIIVSDLSDGGFLRRLQLIHDDNEPYEWVDLFEDFAEREFSMSKKDAWKLVNSLKPVRKVRKGK